MHCRHPRLPRCVASSPVVSSATSDAGCVTSARRGSAGPSIGGGRNRRRHSWCARGAVAGPVTACDRSRATRVRDRRSGRCRCVAAQACAAARRHSFRVQPFRMDMRFSRGMGATRLRFLGTVRSWYFPACPPACISARCRSWTRRGFKGTEGFARVTEPVFSPDGRSIAFYADRALKKIAVTGGEAVTVAPADPPYGIIGERTASSLARASKGILRVSPDGWDCRRRLCASRRARRRMVRRSCRAANMCCSPLATGTARDRWDRARIVVQSLASGVRTHTRRRRK